MSQSKNSRQLAGEWPFNRYSYYENELRKSASLWFAKKKYPVHSKWSYCLSGHADWENNIISNEVKQYIKNIRKKSKDNESLRFHKYIHHGLSSQALAFNLLGPITLSEDYSVLECAFSKEGIHWPKELKEPPQFEYSDRNREVFNEDAGQPTSIDYAIFGDTNVFIEVKLSEKEFGGCSVFHSGDCAGENPLLTNLQSCYLHHIGRQYWNVMREYGFDNTSMAKGTICPFTAYYQFFREVLFALKKNGIFVLLYDERNPAFSKKHILSKEEFGLWSLLINSVPNDLRNKVYRISIQSIVNTIEQSENHTEWIFEFKEKYGL